MSRIGSTGKAFFHTDVRIVDKHGADCEPGVPGEVLARGRRIMAGYWNRPAANAEAIIDGWLHTGDLAVQDADGFIYIQDRIKDMIISGGENVLSRRNRGRAAVAPRHCRCSGRGHAFGEVG